MDRQASVDSAEATRSRRLSVSVTIMAGWFRPPAGETANGKFPDTAVRTMAAIAANAENGNAYASTQAFIRCGPRLWVCVDMANGAAPIRVIGSNDAARTCRPTQAQSCGTK